MFTLRQNSYSQTVLGGVGLDHECEAPCEGSFWDLLAKRTNKYAKTAAELQEFADFKEDYVLIRFTQTNVNHFTLKFP